MLQPPTPTGSSTRHGRMVKLPGRFVHTETAGNISTAKVRMKESLTNRRAQLPVAVPSDTAADPAGASRTSTNTKRTLKKRLKPNPPGTELDPIEDSSSEENTNRSPADSQTRRMRDNAARQSRLKFAELHTLHGGKNILEVSQDIAA
ncbi:hypothetical protein FOZ62_008846, partial [Perkinsus olseni]